VTGWHSNQLNYRAINIYNKNIIAWKHRFVNGFKIKIDLNFNLLVAKSDLVPKSIVDWDVFC
jgi:hypothetical protein